MAAHALHAELCYVTQVAQIATRRAQGLALWIVALTGCAAASPTPPPVPVEPDPALPQPVQPVVSSGSPIEKLFPLVDRNIYQYVTESDDGDGLLTVHAARRDKTHGALEMPAGARQFEYDNDGVKLVKHGSQPSYVLKHPIALGESWRGEHGGVVEIVAVDATVEVPAGSFNGCVKTVEQRGGDIPMRVATTFCPDTGIVELEAASGIRSERAVLKSYGPPVDIGLPGVRVIPPGGD